MHHPRPVRVATNETRTVPAGRPEAQGQGGFPGVLDRAGEAALEERFAELVTPGPPDPSTRAGVAPLLARAVERVALLVNSGAVPSVTLELGRSLEVRIDQARGGVEVTIRAVHGVSPLAEAELPLLVAALRARGVRVARAGVLGRRTRSLTASRSSATTAGDDGTVAKW